MGTWQKELVLVPLGHSGEATSHLNVVDIQEMATEWWYWRDSSPQPESGSVVFDQNCCQPVLKHRQCVSFRSIIMIFFASQLAIVHVL